MIDEEHRHYCSRCGEDCKGVCKYSGEPTSGMWTTEEFAASQRERIPLLIVQRKYKERQRETLDWLINEAEANGLWLWTRGDFETRRGGLLYGMDLPQTEVGEINDTLSKYSKGWHSPSGLRERLSKTPEMYYWAWTVRTPRERVESLRKAAAAVNEMLDKFS